MKKKAFSIIEISIVILIIGILVAGVTQSSMLIKQIKVATARSTTKNSPVNGIKDLALWLETSMNESFIEIQADDEYRLTQWNDVNPQNPSKLYAIKSASNSVTYADQGINSIPSVKFSGDVGTTGYFVLSNTTSIAQATKINTFGNRFTYFIIAQPDIEVVGKMRVAFLNSSDPANAGWGSVKTADSKRGIAFNDNMICSTNTSNSSSTPEVITGVYEGVTSNNMTIYINGRAETTTVSTQSGGGAIVNSGSDDPNYVPVTNSPAFFVGSAGGPGNETWKGLISEIIVFDRVLKNEERKSIEKYLAKKYSIKINE